MGLVFISHDSPKMYKPSTRTGTRFVESRGQLQGEIWLTWGSSARVQFAGGFLTGYHEGWMGACGQSWSGHRNRLDLCEQGAYRLRSGVFAQYYADFVTHFYLTYPNDRDIPIHTLIEFADEKTAEQVHEWADTIAKPASLFH